MSGSLGRVAVTLLIAGLVNVPGRATASGFPYLVADPLGTMPDRVTRGVILPGDSTPIPPAPRQEFSNPLSLGEALDLALANNQKIRWAWAEIKVQAGILGEAVAGYFPTLSGGVTYTKDNISYSGNYSAVVNDRYTVQATATWRLFDFGGRSANHRAAQHLLAAALASHDAALQEVAGNVIRAYFDATIAGAALSARIRQEEIARQTLDSARLQEERGAVSRSDTLRATTALARASLDRSRASGDSRKALAVLRSLLGLPAGTELLLPESLDAEAADGDMRELALWLEEARRSHPAIVAARQQYEAGQEQVKVARSGGLPTLSLSGNYYLNTRPGEAVNPGAQETTLIVGMTIPLFDGFASTYRLRGAQAQADKKLAALADAEERIALEIIRAYADTASALGNLDASALLLESARTALAVSRRKYDKGAADITELLGTQAALADAWNERLRCLAEWHSARLQLLASAGRMGRSAVSGRTSGTGRVAE